MQYLSLGEIVNLDQLLVLTTGAVVWLTAAAHRDGCKAKGVTPSIRSAAVGRGRVKGRATVHVAIWSRRSTRFEIRGRELQA